MQSYITFTWHTNF